MSWIIFLQSIRDKYPLMYAEYVKKSPVSFDAVPVKKRGKKS